MKNLYLIRMEICVLAALAAGTALLLSISSCRSAQKATATEQNSEEAHTVYTSRTSVPDTIVYTLAPQYIERVVHDSVSVISNDYAESHVRLQPDGTMLHSLDSRERVVHVPVQTVTVITDTVYRNRESSNHSTSTPPTKQRSHAWMLVLAGVVVGILLLRKKVQS